MASLLCVYVIFGFDYLCLSSTCQVGRPPRSLTLNQHGHAENNLLLIS